MVEFGTKHLSKPNPKAGIQQRVFHDIHPEIFLARKSEALEKVKTLAGISTRYQYVCEVINCYIVGNNNITIFLDGWQCQVEKVPVFLPSVFRHEVGSVHC